MDSGNVRLEEEAIPIKEDGKKNFQEKERKEEREKTFARRILLYVGIIYCMLVLYIICWYYIEWVIFLFPSFLYLSPIVILVFPFLV